MEPPRPQPKHDPAWLFDAWFDAARARGIAEPEAMTLATASPAGEPSARVVLFKGWSAGRLRFFTSYESRKARELDAGGRAAVVFYWQPLQRQVRIEGRVERLPPDESDSYFSSRPRASRIAALASPQSRPVSSRQQLESKVQELTRAHEGHEPPRPASWGGYGLLPERWEFWTQGPFRLHERCCYVKTGESFRWELLGP